MINSNCSAETKNELFKWKSIKIYIILNLAIHSKPNHDLNVEFLTPKMTFLHLLDRFETADLSHEYATMLARA